MDTFNQQQHLNYLQEQIYGASAILARHRPKPGGYCACLRSLPCTQATAARQRLDHYQQQLSRGDTTAELPTVYRASACTADGNCCGGTVIDEFA